MTKRPEPEPEEIHTTPQLGNLTVTDSEEQALVARWRTMESAEEYAASIGIRRPPKPSAALQPLTSDDLTNFSSKQHAELHAIHLGWYGYWSAELSVIKAKLLETDNILNSLRSAVACRLRNERRATDPDRKITDAAIKAMIEEDPTVELLSIEQQELQQRKTLVCDALAMVEKNMRVISREIEVVKIDAQQSGVGSNIPRRARGFTPGGY